MMGVTDSAQAAPGTIRGDFSLSKEENVVHGSDGPESAAREIALFFGEAELVDPVPQHFWGACLPDRPGEPSIGFAGLVLASRSPQRKLLLEQLGLPFRVVVSEHDEGVSDGNPAHTVQQNARGKAEEVMARETVRAGELVLGVDTVVVCEGEILGKARDEAEAAASRAASRRDATRSTAACT